MHVGRERLQDVRPRVEHDSPGGEVAGAAQQRVGPNLERRGIAEEALREELGAAAPRRGGSGPIAAASGGVGAPVVS